MISIAKEHYKRRNPKRLREYTQKEGEAIHIRNLGVYFVDQHNTRKEYDDFGLIELTDGISDFITYKKSCAIYTQVHQNRRNRTVAGILVKIVKVKDKAYQ